jgi:hypothetical protein
MKGKNEGGRQGKRKSGRLKWKKGREGKESED